MKNTNDYFMKTHYWQEDLKFKVNLLGIVKRTNIINPMNQMKSIMITMKNNFNVLVIGNTLIRSENLSIINLNIYKDIINLVMNKDQIAL